MTITYIKLKRQQGQTQPTQVRCVAQETTDETRLHALYLDPCTHLHGLARTCTHMHASPRTLHASPRTLHAPPRT